MLTLMESIVKCLREDIKEQMNIVESEMNDAYD